MSSGCGKDGINRNWQNRTDFMELLQFLFFYWHCEAVNWFNFRFLVC